MTTTRANVDKKFISRFLIISIGCFLFMLWGLYDGLYTNRVELERAVEYQKLTQKLEDGELTEDERAQTWKKMADENGWSLTKPDDPKHAQGGIYFQWFVFGIGLILGVFFLIKYLRLVGTWVEANNLGLTSSWGQSLQFKNIQKINKRKWETKGIARIEYSDDSGAAKQFVFDDLKYEREKMDEILKEIEKDLSKDQIVGGIPESEREMVALKSADEDKTD